MDAVRLRTAKNQVDIPQEKLLELEDRVVNAAGGSGVIEAIGQRPPVGVVLTPHQKAVVLDVLNRWGMEPDGIAAMGDELRQLRDILDDDLHPA